MICILDHNEKTFAESLSRFGRRNDWLIEQELLDHWLFEYRQPQLYEDKVRISFRIRELTKYLQAKGK